MTTNDMDAEAVVLGQTYFALDAEGFAAAWETAIDRGMQRLEDCALERALTGEERAAVIEYLKTL